MSGIKKNIKDLIQELENIQDIKDSRLAVLILFLYSDYYALALCGTNNIKNRVEFVCNACGKITGSRELSLSEKIRELIDAKILDDKLYEPFNLLNKIRNRLIHDLSPDNNKILKWIEEYNPETTTEQLDEILNSVDPWEMLYVSLITAISNMCQKINNVTTLKAVVFDEDRKRFVFHVDL